MAIEFGSTGESCASTVLSLSGRVLVTVSCVTIVAALVVGCGADCTGGETITRAIVIIVVFTGEFAKTQGPNVGVAEDAHAFKF